MIFYSIFSTNVHKNLQKISESQKLKEYNKNLDFSPRSGNFFLGFFVFSARSAEKIFSFFFQKISSKKFFHQNNLIRPTPIFRKFFNLEGGLINDISMVPNQCLWTSWISRSNNERYCYKWTSTKHIHCI